MTAVFKQFGGLYPVGYETTNNPSVADIAHDVDLESGTIKPWNTDKFVSGVANAKALFEVQGCCIVSDVSHCTSYAEGNPSSTCAEHLYRTKPGSKPQAATHLGACNNTWRELSFVDFPAPSVVAPPVPADDRLEQLYLFYTVTDDWGRESAPSAVSGEFFANFGTSLLVSGFPTAYLNATKIKIYISRAAWSSGNEMEPVEERSGYYLASEFPIGPSSASVTLDMPGPANITWDYQPAPENLWDIQSFRGGQLLGLSDNLVMASIKNTFHAWPIHYAVRFYGNARKLIAGKNIAYVLTDEAPLAMRIPAGCDGPQCFQSKQLDKPLPIASARSAAIFGDTVVYATYDGLVALTGEEFRYFPHWSRSDWRKLRPDSMVGAVHGNSYFLSTDSGVFKLDMLAPATQALTTVSTPGKVLAFHDSTHGRLLVSTDAGIYAWNEGAGKKEAHWARMRSHTGPIRYASVLDVQAVGQATVSVSSGGIQAYQSTVSGDTQSRFCVTRGRDFGVDIITSGEVARVIIGASATQVNQL